MSAVAAGSGVGNREKSGVVSTRRDADTVIKGFGRTVSPAGAAVGLVANVVDYRLALGPVGPSIEVGWQVI